jgi:hypothetical protein
VWTINIERADVKATQLARSQRQSKKRRPEVNHHLELCSSGGVHSPDNIAMVLDDVEIL